MAHYFGERKRNFIKHSLTALPLVNQFLAQGYALVRILNALKIKPNTYHNWRHWQAHQTIINMRHTKTLCSQYLENF